MIFRMTLKYCLLLSFVGCFSFTASGESMLAASYNDVQACFFNWEIEGLVNKEQKNQLVDELNKLNKSFCPISFQELASCCKFLFGFYVPIFIILGASKAMKENNAGDFFGGACFFTVLSLGSYCAEKLFEKRFDLIVDKNGGVVLSCVS